MRERDHCVKVSDDVTGTSKNREIHHLCGPVWYNSVQFAPMTWILFSGLNSGNVGKLWLLKIELLRLCWWRCEDFFFSLGELLSWTKAPADASKSPLLLFVCLLCPVLPASVCLNVNTLVCLTCVPLPPGVFNPTSPVFLCQIVLCLWGKHLACPLSSVFLWNFDLLADLGLSTV